MTHTHTFTSYYLLLAHSAIFQNHDHHPFPLYVFPKEELDSSGVLILCHIKDFTATVPTEVFVLL